MAAYLDTSCLLKLLWTEPETARTIALVEAEDRTVVSDLTWLETKIRIQARHGAGGLTRAGARTLLRRAEGLVALAPFDRQRGSAGWMDVASGQVAVDDRRAHCRTLDRLHLAAMDALGLTRLLTNDDAQARAARGLGLTVLVPR